MTVEHTGIRDFIQRFNDSYDGFGMVSGLVRRTGGGLGVGIRGGSAVSKSGSLAQRGHVLAPRPPLRPALAMFLRRGDAPTAYGRPPGGFCANSHYLPPS